MPDEEAFRIVVEDMLWGGDSDLYYR